MKIFKYINYYSSFCVATVLVVVRIVARAIVLGMDGRLDKIGERRKP